MDTKGNGLGRRQRIESLRRQIAEATGETPFFGSSPDCPPEIEEQFLEHVLAFEQAGPSPLFDQLVAAGVELPHPRDLADVVLAEKLMEIFGALARLGFYAQSTDHLEDRPLYELLWRETLREPARAMPEQSDLVSLIDLIGSGSNEDLQTWLAFYATDEERAEWHAEFPERKLPARKRRLADRDRTLPVWAPSSP